MDSLFDYEFPVIVLPKELTLDAICKVFQAINTTGLRLSAFDICVAKFMPSGINLREKLKAAMEEDSVRIALDGDETAILQTVALLSGIHPKKNKLADNLRQDDVDSWWDKAVSGFDYAIKTLDNFGCGCSKNLSLLPYRPMLPIIAAIYVKKDIESLRAPKPAEIEQKIKTFFFCASLSSRYTEGTDQKITDDYTHLMRWIDGGSPPSFIADGIKWSTSAFIKAKTGAIASTILCIINSCSPKDFYSDKTVGLGSNVEDCDKHHIFPKAKYQADNKELIESIFNKTFLTKESNVFIKDKSTRDYFYELIQTHGWKEDTGKARFSEHFINEATFQAFINEDYDKFLKLRAEEIKNHLKLNIGITIHDVDQSLIDDEDLDDDE